MLVVTISFTKLEGELEVPLHHVATVLPFPP
jgi:hypothetical protein